MINHDVKPIRRGSFRERVLSAFFPEPWKFEVTKARNVSIPQVLVHLRVLVWHIYIYVSNSLRKNISWGDLIGKLKPGVTHLSSNGQDQYCAMPINVHDMSWFVSRLSWTDRLPESQLIASCHTTALDSIVFMIDTFLNINTFITCFELMIRSSASRVMLLDYSRFFECLECLDWRIRLAYSTKKHLEKCL